MNRIFFTPGPAALYFTVDQHIKNAIKSGIPSISHRGKEFISLYQETEQNLRELMAIPSDFHIGFTSSATEIWERSIENLVDTHSYHFVNGSFSEKFYKVSKALGKNAEKNSIASGTNHDIASAAVPEEAELITLVHNETSTGAALPIEDLGALRSHNPEALITVDVVSSAPVVQLPFDEIDSAYFSVQKCFGLPAGLGVWIYNDRCIAKAKKLKSTGKYHDAYNSLLNIHAFAQKNQTTCTPNVLNIYLLGKVAGDMLTKGLDMIRRETAYKSALIYNLFENHESIQPFVKEKKFRSATVGVGVVKGGSNRLIEQLMNQKMVVGSGYGSFKDNHIRIANFPTHSKEQMEMLVDQFESLEF